MNGLRIGPLLIFSEWGNGVPEGEEHVGLPAQPCIKKPIQGWGTHGIATGRMKEPMGWATA